MLLNCGVQKRAPWLLGAPWTARRSNQTVLKESVLNIHWKDWCWSWSSSTLEKKNKTRDTNKSLGTPSQWTGLKVESARSWGLWSLPGLHISLKLLGFSREGSPCPSWSGCQAPGRAEEAHCHPPVEFLSILLISSPFAKPSECGSNVAQVQRGVFPPLAWRTEQRKMFYKTKKKEK